MLFLALFDVFIALNNLGSLEAASKSDRMTKQMAKGTIKLPERVYLVSFSIALEFDHITNILGLLDAIKGGTKLLGWL